MTTKSVWETATIARYLPRQRALDGTVLMATSRFPPHVQYRSFLPASPAATASQLGVSEGLVAH